MPPVIGMPHKYLLPPITPNFINALNPEEIWILEKGNDGFSTIRRASESTLVNKRFAAGWTLVQLPKLLGFYGEFHT